MPVSLNMTQSKTIEKKSKGLDEGGSEETEDGNGDRRGQNGRVRAGVVALGEAPAVLYPAHQAPQEPADEHAHDDAAHNIARIVDSQVDAAITLQQRPCEQ